METGPTPDSQGHITVGRLSIAAIRRGRYRNRPYSQLKCAGSAFLNFQPIFAFSRRICIRRLPGDANDTVGRLSSRLLA